MNTSISEIITTDAIEKMASALESLRDIEAVAITSRLEYENAAEMQKKLKSTVKDLEADRREIVIPYEGKVKEINKKYKSVTSQLKNGIDKIGSAMIAWYEADEVKRQLELRKRDIDISESRKKAEELAENERQKAELYREQGRDDMAEKAEARADAKIAMASSLVYADIPTLKMPGISYRTSYEAVVLNREEAIRELLGTPLTASAVTIDTNFLSTLAKALKGDLHFANIEIKEIKTQVVRTK